MQRFTQKAATVGIITDPVGAVKSPGPISRATGVGFRVKKLRIQKGNKTRRQERR
jgi:hypothetical protein|uniref:Uncharacterized protein n=1 Tax=Siphoviridae sp. ctkkB9 TaxID=2825644 RepID=A0A8S5TZJ5_9CAUD|nr:MAG TPA: hypothetical protein [Siphoviridae sp. ctkkB9]